MPYGRWFVNPSKLSPRNHTIVMCVTTSLTVWSSLPAGSVWADFRLPSPEETMENYLVLAPAPTEEDCVCVGEDDYLPRAREECRRFISLLRKKFGPEPEGARLPVQSFLHDLGNYLEVVCYFDEALPESVEYAMHCEDNFLIGKPLV